MAKRLTYILLCLLLSSASVRGQLIINELMQSNIDCVFDDDTKEFPDSWVELYNNGTDTVQLHEYSLGLTDSYAGSWPLPQAAVAPGHFYLVFCDKVASGCHTDFRLETGKDGALYLFRGGVVADFLAGMPKQPSPNVAYGRDGDGSASWGYMLAPTPRASNDSGTSDVVLGEPVFSEPGHVTTDAEDITLALSLPEGAPDSAVIRYTLDGSEPTIASILYEEPLTFRTNTIIRAKLFCDSCISPRSTTQSYIFLPRQMTLPVVSLVSNRSYFHDRNIGILYREEDEMDLAPGEHANYQYNWRRPVNLEFFPAEGRASALNQLCETRVQGGGTRSENYVNSLAVYAHKRFGTKRFDYEFFPDQKPGLRKFKSLVLRNAGNDFFYCYTRDAIAQRVMGTHVDVDWQAWRPAIIYLNGKYIGMLNIRERSNEDNIYTNYDGLEDIDLIENWDNLKEGSFDRMQAFNRFWHEDGHTMEEYAAWLDIEEYVNAMITDFYFNNLDGFGGNNVEWRPRTEGGRWRLILKDKDYAIGLYRIPAKYRTFEWFHNPEYDEAYSWGCNSEEGTLLFRQLMKDPAFLRLFTDRMAIYMGDFLNNDAICAIWNPMIDAISYEYPYHQRVAGTTGFSLEKSFDFARNWLYQRTGSVFEQMTDYYRLGPTFELMVNTFLSDEELRSSSFTFNGVPLSKGVFNGSYFLNRDLRLKGQTEGDEVVVGWDVTQLVNSYAVSSYYPGDELNLDEIPRCNTLLVQAIFGSRTGIDSIGDAQWRWQAEGDGIVLTQLPVGAIVTLYDLQGRQIVSRQARDSSLRLDLPAGRQVLILRVGSKCVKIVKP